MNLELLSELWDELCLGFLRSIESEITKVKKILVNLDVEVTKGMSYSTENRWMLPWNFSNRDRGSVSIA